MRQILRRLIATLSAAAWLLLAFPVLAGPVDYSSNGGRSWVEAIVPLNGTVWVDNDLTLQNKSIGAGGVGGNASIRYLNSAGVEVGAHGYSHDSALSPSGFYPNVIYTECGSPFGAAVTDQVTAITLAPGVRYPGSPYESWIAYRQNCLTGDIDIGQTGRTPQQVSLALVGTKFRIRERDHINNVGLTVNINDAWQKDDPALPSMAITFGPGTCDWTFQYAPAWSSVMSVLMRLSCDGGLVIGSPPGGSKGPGTINVQGLYVNGVAK